MLRFPPRDTTPPPTTTPPTTTPPTPPPTTPPPTTQPGACEVSWAANQWTGGFTAEVRITNRGAARNGWTLTWSFAADQRVTNAWNAQVTQAGATVTARNVSWNGTLPQGGTASFGLQGTFGTGNPPPDGFRLDGTLCQRLG
ncbi:cellulose-binding domain-containing protein [Micromonospora yangpuensis]|uniref:cellulose-binding domain-containing protein n=1 Tax=Micromonospora yangpuensis TaxID=683228 RepID=UPI00227B2229|nr:cellulose-binding domain-containing protein [Micromonospora yangpuensis]